MAAVKSLFRTVRTTYRRIFKRQEDIRLREAVATLEQTDLFRSFSRTMLLELAEMMHPRTYRRDEVLYYEGDPGLGLYIVQHGRLRLYSEGETGPRELRQVAEHEYAGELSLLGGERRMETAQALTETQVLGFFSPDLKMMLRRNPLVGAEVALSLGRMLSARQVRLVRLLEAEHGKEAALHLLEGASVRRRDLPASPIGS